MKEQDQDQEFELRLRQVFKDAGPDEAFVNEVADSPAVWRHIRQNINEHHKTAASTPWPPIQGVLRWLFVGVPVAAAVVMAFLYMQPGREPQNIALVQPQTVKQVAEAAASVGQPAPTGPVEVITKRVATHPTETVPRVETRSLAVKSSNPAKAVIKKASPDPAVVRTEVKTDFIALSYARDPDSGQIVRVKVPSSMMVSLGLATSVKTPSELVDAEVLVGDDGLTRAIRFIR